MSEKPETRWGRIGIVIAIATAMALMATYAVLSLSNSSGRDRLQTACASLLNVLNPPGSTFERVGANMSASDTVARLLYVINRPGAGPSRAVILCAFEDVPVYGQHPKLVAVSLNGLQLGPARLSFLNRFWLQSVESAAALPSGAPDLEQKS